MGTKNNPGEWDCYANADPNEPMFVLLGRDPMAPALVDMWASARLEKGEDPAKVEEAYTCAASMRVWLRSKGKEEVKAGDFSDGYHSFNDLYEHRIILFCALAQAMRSHTANELKSWKSRLHHDGTSFPGWFLAGIDLEAGTITYHLPDSMWEMFVGKELERAPEWDGHTAADVVKRLESFVMESFLNV